MGQTRIRTRPLAAEQQEATPKALSLTPLISTPGRATSQEALTIRHLQERLLVRTSYLRHRTQPPDATEGLTPHNIWSKRYSAWPLSLADLVLNVWPCVWDRLIWSSHQYWPRKRPSRLYDVPVTRDHESSGRRSSFGCWSVRISWTTTLTYRCCILLKHDVVSTMCLLKPQFASHRRNRHSQVVSRWWDLPLGG